jgi:hypothetical protein
VIGTLAALIDLGLSANLWLASRAASPPPVLLGRDDTFKHVKSVSVAQQPAMRLRGRATDGTAAWFRSLRQSGAKRVSLVFSHGEEDMSPRFATAFSEAGGWGLVSDARKPVLWFAEWDVGDREDPDGRIWKITLMGEKSALRAPVADIQSSAAELRAALTDLGQFAASHDGQAWADVMKRAIAQLDDPHPECAYYPEMVPPGSLRLEQMQLLSAATHGWVFGGMGSWNDNAVSVDVKEHERVSSRLWLALLGAMASVVNS